MVLDVSQDTLGAPPATEIKLEEHCPYKYGFFLNQVNTVNFIDYHVSYYHKVVFCI